MSTIYVEIRDQYGREAIHPACPRSRLFADLAGTKTLTRDAIALIKSLGETIVVKHKHPAVSL